MRIVIRTYFRSVQIFAIILFVNESHTVKIFPATVSLPVSGRKPSQIVCFGYFVENIFVDCNSTSHTP